MKQEPTDYYKKKGFVVVYINTNKESRRVATLRRADGTMTSMSYAKYIYTSHCECDIADGDQVDHINNDKTDDRIENLQVISRRLNIAKSAKRRELVILTCPICGKDFLFRKSNLPFKKDPCCSRECGYKKTSHTLKERARQKKNNKTPEDQSDCNS